MEETIKSSIWQASLGTIGAVGAVIWAANSGHKGKFWWFIGGGMIGGAIGMILDSANKK
jgi:uncharacterized membrane protein